MHSLPLDLFHRLTLWLFFRLCSLVFFVSVYTLASINLTSCVRLSC